VTATLPAPATATPEIPLCHWCDLPVIPCPVRAEGYVTHCGGWVHVPPPGRDHGRHSCGASGPRRQAVPDLLVWAGAPELAGVKKEGR
jgi:hypothetical protein